MTSVVPKNGYACAGRVGWVENLAGWIFRTPQKPNLLRLEREGGNPSRLFYSRDLWCPRNPDGHSSVMVWTLSSFRLQNITKSREDLDPRTNSLQCSRSDDRTRGTMVASSSNSQRSAYGFRPHKHMVDGRWRRWDCRGSVQQRGVREPGTCGLAWRSLDLWQSSGRSSGARYPRTGSAAPLDPAKGTPSRCPGQWANSAEDFSENLWEKNTQPISSKTPPILF